MQSGGRLARRVRGARRVLFLIAITASISIAWGVTLAQDQSKALQGLLGSAERPTAAVLQSNEKTAFDALSRALESNAELANKRAVVWVLAFRVDGSGAGPLRLLLTRDYAGRALSKADEQTLLDDLRLLGFVAHRDAAIFQFLTQHVEPEAWAKTKKWTSSRGEYANDLLTSFAIQAIGMSARAEVSPFLGTLQKRSPNYLHRFSGDIVQAWFYRHLRDRLGETGLRRYIVEGDDTKAEFQQWIRGDGKSLFEWANERMRGPRPPD